MKKQIKKTSMLSKVVVANLLCEAVLSNVKTFDKTHLDHVTHNQALKDNTLFDAHVEALKDNTLFDAHVKALKENFSRKLATFTNRERNNLIRESQNERATKFSKCIKVESQSYKIERSLEQFRTIQEHCACSKQDEKRVKRHVSFLLKEQNHTCRIEYDAKDNKKFRFINI